jgi:hypothetical protein
LNTFWNCHRSGQRRVLAPGKRTRRSSSTYQYVNFKFKPSINQPLSAVFFGVPVGAVALSIICNKANHRIINT